MGSMMNVQFVVSLSNTGLHTLRDIIIQSYVVLGMAHIYEDLITVSQYQDQV